MDKGGTLTKGAENKKVDDDAQGLTSKRRHRLYMSRKGGRRRAYIEEGVLINTRSQRLR